MPCFICRSCGTQFAESPVPPSACPSCLDERRAVPVEGAPWTTLNELRRAYRNVFQRIDPQLYGIGTMPRFPIGQRALLVATEDGNMLWDCIALLDDATIDFIRAVGGLRGIAISHPHYYSTMIEWSSAFGKVPIYLHAADQQWVMRPDPAIHFWKGNRLDVFGSLSLIHCGGHFAGGAVLHWPAGAAGKGALLVGDIMQVVPDRTHLSFMWSYPGLIPLSSSQVERVAGAVESLEFDRIYGAWWDLHIEKDAKAILARSVERYIAAISG
jgi:hypothetical protein